MHSLSNFNVVFQVLIGLAKYYAILKQQIEICFFKNFVRAIFEIDEIKNVRKGEMKKFLLCLLMRKKSFEKLSWHLNVRSMQMDIRFLSFLLSSKYFHLLFLPCLTAIGSHQSQRVLLVPDKKKLLWFDFAGKIVNPLNPLAF